MTWRPGGEVTASVFNPQPPVSSRKEYVLLEKSELCELRGEVKTLKKQFLELKKPEPENKSIKWLVSGAAAAVLLGACYAAYLLYGEKPGQAVDRSLVILIIVISNSVAQIFVDFFPSKIKAKYSALARLVPAIAAVAAFLK